MSWNNPNNPLHDPQQLPDGFRFRQEAVWQRMEKRLQPVPGKRRIPVAWLAAACLLIIAFATWIFNGEMPDAPATVTTNLPKQTPVLQITNSGNERSRAKAESTVAHVVKAARIQKSATLKKATLKERPQPGAITIPIDTTIIASAPGPVLPATSVAVKTPRYRVAHINELPSPLPNAALQQIKEPARAYTLRKMYDIPEASPADPLPGTDTRRGLFSLKRSNE